MNEVEPIPLTPAMQVLIAERDAARNQVTKVRAVLKRPELSDTDRVRLIAAVVRS